MKALVIGADGTIGRSLARHLRLQGHQVFATSRRPASADGESIHLDLGDDALDAMHLPQTDAAFFCAAVTKFSDCRTNPSRARRINVEAPAFIAQRLVDRGTQVVLLSTSAVFDWSTPQSDAARLPCPLTVYGRLKADAETRFLRLGPAASILRLSKVLAPDYGLINGWIGDLAQRRTIAAFSDLHMAPVSLQQVVTTLQAIALSRPSGIFQLSATRDISYFDAALHIAARLGVPPSLVSSARAAEAGIPPEEVIQYSSLDTSRLREIGGNQAPDSFDAIDAVFGHQFQQAMDA